MLDWIEWAGNKLPEPAILFALLAALVVVSSGVGSWVGWKVQPVELRLVVVDKVGADGRPVLDEKGKPVQVPKAGPDGKPEVKLQPAGAPLEPRSLMTGEGVYWMLSSMVRNFTGMPALGLIFVSMLGIGLAEKFGLFGALMRWLALLTPRALLTPMIVFIGANSSVASDAGYIILPPLAAALFAAVGRSPVAGMAAAFCGVAGGFGGGLFPTAGDGFLAGVATTSAHIIDPAYGPVDATHNLYFKILSAVVVMLGGWYVTDRVVEPRLLREVGRVSGDTAALTDMALSRGEKAGLAWAGVVLAVVLGAFAALVFVPGAPLHGVGQPTLASGRVLMEHPVTITPPPALPQGVPGHDIVLRDPLAGR
ncbi:MAG: AbgT family transporter [Phycisphaerales bacterium]|nr:AbgT family transporter [Phycisphaerales bacterium]